MDIQSGTEFSFGLFVPPIRSHDSNANNLRLFALKMTELEQFLFGLVDFSKIHDFQKMAIFTDFGALVKMRITVTIWGVDT